jgi:hypothetical protein
MTTAAQAFTDQGHALPRTLFRAKRELGLPPSKVLPTVNGAGKCAVNLARRVEECHVRSLEECQGEKLALLAL